MFVYSEGKDTRTSTVFTVSHHHSLRCGVESDINSKFYIFLVCFWVYYNVMIS